MDWQLEGTPALSSMAACGKRVSNDLVGAVMLSRLAAALLGTWSSVALPAAINASEVDARGIEFYEEKIRPVFAEHCYECHSRQAQLRNNLKGGLFLDS